MVLMNITRITTPILLACLVCLPPTLSAQNVEPVNKTTATVELKPIAEEQAAELDQAWEAINGNAADIAELEKRVANESGIMRQVLELRADSLVVQTIETALGFAGRAADLRDEGYDISAYAPSISWALETLPPSIERSAERIRARVTMPDFSKSAVEQAAIDEQFFAAVRVYNKVNGALLDTQQVAARFDIDVGDIEADVRRHVENSAVNTSVFLDLALAEVNKARAGLAVLPEDAELMAQLKVAESRVQQTANILKANVDALTKLGMPTTQYKQQLLTATGAITAVALDVNVIIEVVRDWGDAVVEYVALNGPDLLFQVLLFFVIVWVFYKLAGLVQRGVNKALDANRQHLSQLLRHMISSVTRNVIIILGILIALSQFGISLGPLLAGLGIAGFIVGFALQDSLSNFASGMMILFYRPFDVGDTIIAGGASGKVSSMSLVNTTIRTFDNQSLIIPNNKIWQDVITNLTDQTQRRVDMEFGITYAEDIDRVEKILRDVVTADERVLADPEPMIKVGSFGDSSVNILCRPWVKTDDYWDVLWDMNKKIKQAFDREGVVIPFPQRDVHLIQETPTNDGIVDGGA